MPLDPPSLRPEHPQREPSFSATSRQLGMWILLVSLGVLFVASIVAYLITRSRNPEWSNIVVTLPWGLAVAGVFLVATSSSIELARAAIGKNQQQRLQAWLWATGLCAAGFLLAQAINWRSVLLQNPNPESRALSLFIFYMLTGLHALHVLGGFVPLGIVLFRARQREYSSSRHEGIRLCAQYWHFLGVMWLLLMATMLLG
jgi:cytochrome c oxidase subunit 3